jgi:DnaJ-class molecular chaperone
MVNRKIMPKKREFFQSGRVILRSGRGEKGMSHRHRCLLENESENARCPMGDSSTLLLEESRTKPPFVVKVEQNCEDCGGSGKDRGSLSPIDPEECPVCHGSGKQVIVRNYLAEAFRIAAGTSSLVAQREHLKAVIQHCRSLVGAVMLVGNIW